MLADIYNWFTGTFDVNTGVYVRQYTSKNASLSDASRPRRGVCLPKTPKAVKSLEFWKGPQRCRLHASRRLIRP
jgi:hypothetical protein